MEKFLESHHTSTSSAPGPSSPSSPPESSEPSEHSSTPSSESSVSSEPLQSSNPADPSTSPTATSPPSQKKSDKAKSKDQWTAVAGLEGWQQRKVSAGHGAEVSLYQSPDGGTIKGLRAVLRWMVDTQPQATPPLTNTTSGYNKYLTCLE